jgi:hypothetical protein
MSAKEQVFSKKVEKASAEHSYIHITKDATGKFKTSSIKLRGFRQMFERDSHFVYVPALRCAGREELVFEYLTSLSYDEKDVRKYMSDVYSASNCNARLRDIEGEIQSVPTQPKAEKKSVSLDDIIRMRPLLDNVKFVSAKGEETESASELKTFKAKSKTDLTSRLDSLDADKVLDITGFNPETNTGLSNKKRTTGGSRRPLAAAGLLNRVVFDFNKGTEVAVKALIHLGMSKTASEKAVNEAVSSIKTVSLDKIAVKK